MKYFYALLLSCSLVGCEVFHEPGIVVREPVTKAGKYGPVEKMEKVLVLNADTPGLASVPTKNGPILFNKIVTSSTVTTTDPKTGVVTTSTVPVMSGMRVTERVVAAGAADKSRSDSFWSGITGAFLSMFATPALVKGGNAVVNTAMP